MTAGRRKILDRELPGWSAIRTDDAYWEQKLVACAEFWAREARGPRVTGHRITAGERDLGHWLYTQRNGRHLSAERIARLDVALPSWRQTKASAGHWERRARAAADWVATSGRLPRRTALDPGERTINNWITGQRSAPLTGEQVAFLDREVSGWRGRDR